MASFSATIQSSKNGAAARRMALTVAVCLGLLRAMSAAAQPLSEMLRQALASDPAIAAAQAQVRAAQERVAQARAGFGPTAAITGSVTESRYREAPDFELRNFRSVQGVFQVTQPLFRGSLLPSLEAAQAQLLQAQAALAQAQTESAQRLVEAAFDVLKARDTLAHAQAQRASADEQSRSAKRSFELGTAAVTDWREAQAHADAVAAQVLAAQAELGLRQQVLAELAGQSQTLPDGATSWMTRSLDGQHLPDLPPGAVLQWLADASTLSPQIAQARQALEQAQAEVRKAAQGHAPTLDATYAFTTSKDTGTVTSAFPRRGDTSAVGLNLNIPLFASGATQSRVRETMALRDKAQADLDAARRSVSLAARQAFASTLAAIGQARGLEAAQVSQALALRANQRGYAIGMKVNAQVLEAQSKLFEARRDLSRARYDAWSGYIKLKALAGRLDAADVLALDGVMVSDVAQAEGATR